MGSNNFYNSSPTENIFKYPAMASGHSLDEPLKDT